MKFPTFFKIDRFSVVLPLKVSVLLLATSAIFYQDLLALTDEALHSELINYMLAVPFLILYLLYRKRRMLKAVIPFKSKNGQGRLHMLVGALLCLIAFLLYWHGSYTFTPLKYHLLSLPIFIAGSVLLLFDASTLRVLAFPIAFLFLLVPPPIEIVHTLGAHLSHLSSLASSLILKALGLPVTLAEQQGTPLITLVKTGVSPLVFSVDVACSGVYSLLGFAIFAIFVAYICRGNMRKKFAILLLGLPLIYLLNILRIVAVVLIGNYYGMQTGMQAFHILGGFVLIFLGFLSLLIVSEKVLNIQLFTKLYESASCSECRGGSVKKRGFCPNCGGFLKSIDMKLQKLDIGRMGFILLIAIVVVTIQVPVFTLTEGPTEVLTRTPKGHQEEENLRILPDITGYESKFVYRDEQFEEISGQDASLTYAYTPENRKRKIVWVTVEIAKARSSLHSWMVCVQSTSGWTQLELKDFQLLKNLSMTARYLVFQREDLNQTQAVLYWYEKSPFSGDGTLKWKHIKTSLIAFSENREGVENMENNMLPIAKAIVNHWQPIKTGSIVAFTISQNSLPLILILSVGIILTFFYKGLRGQKSRKSRQKAHEKLPKDFKNVLRALRRTEEENKFSTARKVAESYLDLTKERVNPTWIVFTLEKLEKIGLVKRDIISREDEPILVWRSLNL